MIIQPQFVMPAQVAGNGYPDNCIVLIVRTTTSNETFTWPARTGTYDCHFDWGDGDEADYTDAPSAHTYATAGDYEIIVTGTFPHPYFNNGGDRLKVIGGALNGTTGGGLTFLGAFFGCSNLVSLDTSQWNTIGITLFASSFRMCSSLTRLDTSLFDTSSVTSFANMFNNASALEEVDVSMFDTSNCTNFSYMFNGDKPLTELDMSGWDLRKATTFSGIFQSYTNLSQASIDSFLQAAYNSRNGMTWAAPTLGLLSAPSGTYQDPSPSAPSTGKEYEYILENDPNGEGFNVWSITY